MGSQEPQLLFLDQMKKLPALSQKQILNYLQKRVSKSINLNFENENNFIQSMSEYKAVELATWVLKEAFEVD